MSKELKNNLLKYGITALIGALMTFTTLWSGFDYFRAYLPVLDLNQ